MHLDKFISISESNNAWVLERSSQPMEASGVFWGGSPDASEILQLVSKKNTHF